VVSKLINRQRGRFFMIANGSSLQEVVTDINTRRRRFPLWTLALLLVFIPMIGIPLAILMIILLAVFVDKRRKTTELLYTVNQGNENELQNFYKCFNELANCCTIWYVYYQRTINTIPKDYGTNQYVNRTVINVSFKPPKYLKTNINIPALPVDNASSNTIYFFPDMVLLDDKKQVRGISYDDIRVTHTNARFKETGKAPSDGTIVGHEWLYPRKDGKADRRYSYNPHLPIMLYSEVKLHLSSESTYIFWFSQQGAGTILINTIEYYKKSKIWSEIASTQKSDNQVSDIHHSQIVQSNIYTSDKVVPVSVSPSNQLDPYTMFKKMRQLGEHNGSYADYNGEYAILFHKQALFMKDFTDNCSSVIPLDTHYATYSKMNDAQLRTYFTWRTKVRQDIIEKTSISYVFCYIYELLNDVGISNPIDAIEKMITLWRTFRNESSAIDYYLGIWVRDYYATHKMQISSEFSQKGYRFTYPYHYEENKLIAKAISCTWDDLYVIEASSYHKITDSRFYKESNRKNIEKCVCFTIQELAKVFKNEGVDFKNMIYEKRYDKIYYLFERAVHTNAINTPKSSLTVKIDDYETLIYNGEGWYREYIYLRRYKRIIGYILSLIELKMRKIFNYHENLRKPVISVVENYFLKSEAENYSWPEIPSLNKLTAWKRKAIDIIKNDNFEKIIESIIIDFCKSQGIVINAITSKGRKPIREELAESKEKKSTNITINHDKLKDIERDHNQTLEMLIIEEQNDEKIDINLSQIEKVVTSPTNTGIAGLITSLHPEGRTLLLALLTAKQTPPNSEILIDNINEKAQEAISDNLIVNDNGTFFVYDEYIDEIKSILGGR